MVTRTNHKDLIKRATQLAAQASALEEALNEPVVGDNDYRDITISAQVSIALSLAAIAAMVEVAVTPYGIVTKNGTE
jgi:hypothetical protein